jgi:hypothetical protein
MKGFPKHFNSRADVEAALAVDPERTKAILSQMLDEERDWFFAGKLASPEDGIEDAAHKVVCDDPSAEAPSYSQYELRECPSSPLRRIGMSAEEAEAVIMEG